MASSLSLTTFEALDAAYTRDALLNASHDFLTCDDATARRICAASRELLDACIDAGMSHDHADHRGWAAEALTRTLEAA